MTKEKITELQALAEQYKAFGAKSGGFDIAAMLDLLNTIDRAVGVIKYYADKEHWYMNDGDLQVITPLDFSEVTRSFDTKQCGGKRAREFLASLEGGKDD